MHTLNTDVPNFKKQTLLNIKGHTDPNAIIVGDVNAPLSLIGPQYTSR